MAVHFSRSRQSLPREGGVTLVIVAASLVALLGVAALAIDLVNLYVARGETQRAADAAALLGAKALVDYGVTSGDTSLQAAAQTYATAMARGAARQNFIVGQSVPGGNVAVTYPNAATPSAFAINPQIQVTVTRTGLPSFFAKVWAAGASTTIATARAEAYNPSNATSVTGGATLPVAARCVKPWLLPNWEKVTGGSRFLDPATGAITPGIVGTVIRVRSRCGPSCSSPTPPSTGVSDTYYPLDLDVSTAYQDDVQSCNGRYVACGDMLALDTTDATVEPNPNLSAVQTLINAGGPNMNQGQDAIVGATPPFRIQVEANNPLVTGGVLADGALVSTSPSVVTVPVYDSGLTGNVAPANPSRVIGFIQAFVTDVSGPPAWPVNRWGRPGLVILNVAGCGAASGTPIVGAGGSAVPIRLIR